MNLEQKINSSMNNWEKVTPIFDEATKGYFFFLKRN